MEEDVFIKIYKAYAPSIYHYLYSLTGHHQTTEDLMQETFVRAISITQTSERTIKAWLLTVAHNLYVDYKKKMYRLDLKEQNYFDRISRNVLEDEILKDEHRREIARMIEFLPESQKQVVLLCKINDLSYKEVSKILGLSVASVTNLIYRARINLKKWRDGNE